MLDCEQSLFFLSSSSGRGKTSRTPARGNWGESMFMHLLVSILLWERAIGRYFDYFCFLLTPKCSPWFIKYMYDIFGKLGQGMSLSWGHV